MSRLIILVAIVCGFTAACDEANAPTLGISNVQIYAPLPGSNMSVAYLSVTNRGDNVSQLLSVSSSQYGRIELHATTETDGVARMRRVDSVTIPANDEVDFAPGGLHIMLMEPIENLTTGMPVSMQFNFNDNLLIVSAVLQERNSIY